jgi:hypothetical protein
MTRLALTFMGGLLVGLGALWVLQGLGIILWPADSAMIAQREWALYGGIAATLGAAILLLASRIGRNRS